MAGTRLGNQIRAASPSDNVADVCVHLPGLVRRGGVTPSTRVARALETGSASYCATSARTASCQRLRQRPTFNYVSPRIAFARERYALNLDRDVAASVAGGRAVKRASVYRIRARQPRVGTHQLHRGIDFVHGARRGVGSEKISVRQTESVAQCRARASARVLPVELGGVTGQRVVQQTRLSLLKETVRPQYQLVGCVPVVPVLHSPRRGQRGFRPLRQDVIGSGLAWRCADRSQQGP